MKYKRILLKLSGESLTGDDGYGVSYDHILHYAQEIKSAVDAGVQVAVVIGGGNIFRGVQGASSGFERRQGDQMGMLATIINALAVQGVLEGMGVKARVLSAVNIEGVCEKTSWRKAIESLEAGYVTFLGGGTGNPFFTTDTGAALRALEIKADLLINTCGRRLHCRSRKRPQCGEIHRNLPRRRLSKEPENHGHDGVRPLSGQ